MMLRDIDDDDGWRLWMIIVDAEGLWWWCWIMMMLDADNDDEGW